MTRCIRDAAYPGLSYALDVDTVVEALRAALPECRNGTSLLGGTIVDVRYRPGGPCWVLYNLKLRHGDDRSGRQFLSGRVLRADEPPLPAPDALLQRYAGHPSGILDTPVVSLPQAPMVLYAFPVDESLPGLFEATDPDAMRRHLGELWQDRRIRVRSVRPTMMGYTPHARAAIGYEVLSESRRSGVPELRHLVGKMHAKKEPSRLFADAWAVWRAARGRVNLAPPVGYVPGAGLTLQERVAGERLGGLVDAPDFRRSVRDTGLMLAKLHALSVPLSGRRRAADEVQSVIRWAGVLSTIRPDLTARVERLRDRIAGEVSTRTRAGAPIHGDFHHTNILVDDANLTFIDLDEMALGDPMVDVGRFLASLRVPARRVFGNIGALSEAGEHFLEAYLRRGGGDERRARLFESAGLLIAGASAFRVQRPTWFEEVVELIGEAERVLEYANRVTVPPPDDAPKGGEPPDHAQWAGDSMYMQAMLAPHVRRVHGVELLECRAEAHSHDGKARRFRYSLRARHEDRSWTRVFHGVVGRGGARRTLERVEALRLLLDDAADSLLLPRSIAYLGGISLQVWEPPAGTRFPDLVGTAEALTAAERLGTALAALHRAPLELLSAPRTLDESLQDVGGRLELFRATQPALAEAATQVHQRLARLTLRVPVRLAPALRTLHPSHVVWNGSRAGLQRVDDIVLSHPFLDAGDFVARCALLGATEQRPDLWDAIGDRFRTAFLAAAPEDGADFPVFEAGRLLRLAIGRQRDADSGLTHRLVGMAEGRLAAGTRST